jgi:ABC-type transport system involved in multi-copper enzyme maturation permease subunit
VNPTIVYIICGVLIAAALFLVRQQFIFGVSHGVASIYRIAGITFAETRRRRILQVVILLAAIMLVAMLTVTHWSPAEAQKAIISGGLDLINLFGIMVATFICAFLIPTDIDKRTIYSVLSKPVKRWEFVIGKYFGAMAVVGLLVAVMIVVQMMVLLFAQSHFDLRVQLAGVVAYFGIAVFAAAVMAISTVASSLTTVIAGVLLWILGSLQAMAHSVIAHVDDRYSQSVMAVVSAILPHIEKYNLSSEAADALTINYAVLGQSLLHGLGYVVVALILASILFNERQV